MNAKIRLLAPVLIVLATASAGAWWYLHRPAVDDVLTLYGNVDFRQASVPFNGSERITEILVEEGALVEKGQLLARLDTSRLLPQLKQAEAALQAQQAAVQRLQNGTRKEEIAQARASLKSAQADAVNATAQYERSRALGPAAAISRQDMDQAKAAADMAAAKVEVSQNALKLAVVGPRAEDIAQARAQLRGFEAQLALLRQQVADAELRAPFDAVVQSRLMEPGELASPAKPVFSLATTGTKWVRAYVSAPGLSRVRQGQPARIVIDSQPNQALDGWVGFISSVAEFTPKTVQTEDLRTSLVYEVRVFVSDAGNVLRLGMPATVKIRPNGEGAGDVPAR
ncbi:MAG: HlyD family efflux transporter periplasmic adaptor subunit [Burkholderiaceae bacterium]|jgi:HlyD family secretion protein|nr:HlyD family efflux transporter periplasmic adaptor subunit [Burkholderiaceae bacterium]